MDSLGKGIIDLTGDSDGDAQQQIASVSGSAQAGEREEHRGNKESKKSDKKKKARIKRISAFFRDKASHRHISSRFQLSRLRDIPTNGQSVILANPATQHIGTTLLDRGWACGYRNCQMLLSSVLSGAKNVSDEDAEQRSDETIPSVRKLQEMLEMAWSEGYDADGAQQLGYRVFGTRKWIGTTEIYCILAHMGVRSAIVDFHCPTAPDGSHSALFSWIFDYFTDGQTNAAIGDVLAGQPAEGDVSVRFVAKHPLYLQHQGHSRTVIGVEMGESGISLLVFDPDVDPGPGDRLSVFRYTLFSTRGVGQYQVLYVDQKDEDDSQQSTSDIPKQISSRRIP
ncbi:hypothetical protein H4R99_000303 [Coemansia sp. RSA 1722]|nr:hypothetical protein LPJ57_006002 [Coemansia sp. RSA 486]KAJ2222111.1 hypothetical protein IWW45_008696 [Coemansia sp. RSA 485]KAJ2606471.1 hypothetical protein H4R99_000303 [Coemansia sp. RSA 1722]KAJ2638818.1 hypothetical protein GGF40_001359 [Coemansia sp. RSA 1286]